MVRWVWLTVFAAAVAFAQTVAVVNPSLTEGTNAPAGWTLSEGKGEWLATGPDGARALSVTGNGDDTNFWYSAPLELAPNAVYRLRYRARNFDASGVTAVTGPTFANRDIGTPAAEWTWYTQVFRTPRTLAPADAWLRFGQWHLNGRIAFSQVSLTRAEPVYVTAGGLTLGEGESLQGHDYKFQAPLNSESGLQSRPLESYQASFNTNRWVFGAGDEVIYQHNLGDRPQSAAGVEVTIGYYAGGELVVEASRDGRQWTPLGTLGQSGGASFALPASLLPSPTVWVRLKAQAKQKVGGNSDPGSFQVNTYGYHATLGGEPAELVGHTRFVAVPRADDKLRVRLTSFGEGLPGGDNRVTGSLENATAQPLRLKVGVGVGKPGAKAETVARELTIPAGGTAPLAAAYTVAGPGAYDLAVTVDGDAAYRAETTLQVADLYATNYGERLPASGDRVGLWWCSSGWKISRTRPVPAAAGAAVRITAAQNEAEAAQVVLRPATDLKGLTATPTALAGPGGATLAADRIDLLRVRYVDVVQPTDATGVAAAWPDPLPPMSKPLDLAAGRNQPLWVRVRVPKGAAPGEYRGSLRLAADGWQAQVPLSVRVYGFELPDTPAVTTSFGFGSGLVTRYHGLKTPEQQRAVIDKYLANYAAHHISIYNPTPFASFRVTWPNSSNPFGGGVIDATVTHEGRPTLKLADTSAKANVSAGSPSGYAIPAGGLRLRFWFKTDKPGQPFIVTLNHFDANGQWMSGRNNDVAITGNGDWQLFDQTVTSFPAGAKEVRLSLWAAPWAEDGHTLGTVWYDQVDLSRVADGKALLHAEFTPVTPDQLKPIIDWTEWDQAMEQAIAKYHVNSFTIPIQGMGGGTFFSREEPSLLGYKENTPEYKAAFSAYCQAVQEHLRQKGWLDKGYVYWFDEPDTKDFPFVLNGFLKLKAAAPDLRRMITKEPSPGLFGGPNIWCTLTNAYDPAKAEPRKALGEQFWWYVCTGPKAPYATLFIDHPATEMRVWLWQTWQRGVTGILVWETNYWTSGAAYPDAAHPQNPYEDPMSWVSGYDSKAGQKSGWGNGDGRFVYPPEAAAEARPAQPVLDGPVDSLRWEMLRDGIDDYEYLYLLREALGAKGSRLPVASRAKYQALLEVPAAISASMTTFTKDPAPIEARRAEVAAALEELAKR